MSDFELVKDRINFADYVARHLPVKGHKTLCIWHADKTPSLHIYADHCHCFQCQKYGDIFDFAMQYHHWTRQEALMELAREAGVTLTPLSPQNKEKADKRERLYMLMGEAAKLYHHHLLATGHHAYQYLMQSRGLSEAVITDACLGYAPDQYQWATTHFQSHGYTDDELIAAGLSKRSDTGKLYDFFRNRVLIPYRDTKGRVVAFTGRAASERQTPKYLHNATTDIFEKSKIIHRMPLNQATRGLDALKTLIVVEGSFDPISAANSGFFNVVSQMGSSLTSDQLSLLCRDGVETIILCLDKDKAGDESARRSILAHAHTCADKGVTLKVMHAPYGKDPDDTFREHPELWQPAVDAARPAIDALIDQEMSRLPAGATSIDKQRVAQSLIPLLKGSNALLQEDSLKALAAALGYSLDTMMTWTHKQPDLRVLSPVKPAAPVLNITQMELTVLHGILVNDDQRWIDRANATLARLNDDYPNALQPLSRMDFSSQTAYDLMTLIEQAVKGERPIDAYMYENTSTGPLSETYWRAFYQPKIQAMVNVNASSQHETLDYSDFTRAVIRLRRVRLQRDVSGYPHRINGSLLAEWIKCGLFLGNVAI